MRQRGLRLGFVVGAGIGILCWVREETTPCAELLLHVEVFELVFFIVFWLVPLLKP